MSVAPGEWITPDEVQRIASEIRAVARGLHAVFNTANQVGNQLDVSWYGNAKNIFDGHFQGFPKEILTFADQLEQMANEIQSIRIWVPKDSV